MRTLDDSDRKRFDEVSEVLLGTIRDLGEISCPSYERTIEGVEIQPEEERAYRLRYLHGLLSKLSLFDDYKRRFTGKLFESFEDVSPSGLAEHGLFFDHCNCAMNAYNEAHRTMDIKLHSS